MDEKSKNMFGFQVVMEEEIGAPSPYDGYWHWSIRNKQGRVLAISSLLRKAACKRTSSKIAKSLGIKLQILKNT